jgi:hypothetical protein
MPKGLQTLFVSIFFPQVLANAAANLLARSTMTRKTILAIPATLLLGVGLFYFYGGHTVPAGQPALVTLTPQNLSGIEEAFNAAKSDVRLLVLLSPT